MNKDIIIYNYSLEVNFQEKTYKILYDYDIKEEDILFGMLYPFNIIFNNLYRVDDFENGIFSKINTEDATDKDYIKFPKFYMKLDKNYNYENCYIITISNIEKSSFIAFFSDEENKNSKGIYLRMDGLLDDQYLRAVSFKLYSSVGVVFSISEIFSTYKRLKIKDDE